MGITSKSLAIHLGIVWESLESHLGQHKLDYPLLGLHSDYTFEMILCGGMGAFVYDMYLLQQKCIYFAFSFLFAL